MKTLDDARAQAAKNLGLDLKGTKGSNLSQKDFFRLEDAMVDVILDDELSYPDNIVTWATNKKNGAFYGLPPASSSISEKIGIFTDEFVAQGQAINPFSEQNRGKTALGIWGILLTAAAIFAAVVAFKSRPGQ